MTSWVNLNGADIIINFFFFVGRTLSKILSFLDVFWKVWVRILWSRIFSLEFFKIVIKRNQREGVAWIVPLGEYFVPITVVEQ